MGNLQRTRLSNSTWRWKRNNWSNNWSSPVIFLMSCSLFLASLLVITWYVTMFPRLLSFTPLCYCSIPRICLSPASPISTPSLGHFWKPAAFCWVRQLIPKHWILSIRAFTHGWRTKRTGHRLLPYRSFPTQFDDHARQGCAEILRCSSGRQPNHWPVDILGVFCWQMAEAETSCWEYTHRLFPIYVIYVDTQPLYDSASATTKFRKNVVRSWESSPPRLWEYPIIYCVLYSRIINQPSFINPNPKKNDWWLKPL